MLIKKVLIGVDNSKFAENAAKYGFDIAHKFGATVGLVHIVEPIALPYTNTSDVLLGSSMEEVNVVNELEIMNIQEDLSKKTIENFIKKFSGDTDITHFTEFGNTADGIINCSKEFKADIIVIGTHSRTGIDRLLMGSVAEHVVRHSEIPVLVVPLIEKADS